MKIRSCAITWGLLLSGAALTALTLIFPQVGILEWLTMIPLFLGVFRLCDRKDMTLKKAYGYGFAAVYFFYFIIYHWFLNLYPLDFVGMDNASSAVVVAAAWLGLPVLQAVVGGFIFLFFRLFTKNGIFQKLPLLRPFVFAALWVVFEWTSTLTWAGVPWGRLALGQAENLPLLQSASLLGSYFVTFLLVSVNGLLAYGLYYRTRTLTCAAVAVSLFLSNLGYGLFAEAQAEKGNGDILTAAVIQGNIDSREKWGEDAFALTSEVYARLTREAAERGAELIVWPESVFPNTINKRPMLRDFVCELAKECEVTMIIGAFYSDDDGYYNSLVLITPDGTMQEGFYAKQHLVPFGEYVPMREVVMTLIPPLAEVSALDSDLTPGNGSSLFETPWGAVGSLICFDSIYEALALQSVRDGADLMIISSNDNWFYDSAAVYQHKAQAQLRAVETGRYFVRAASSGISAIIAPDGEVLTSVAPLEEGYGIAEVHVREQKTLYTHVGNLLVYLFMIGIFVLLLFQPFCKIFKKKK